MNLKFTNLSFNYITKGIKKQGFVELTWQLAVILAQKCYNERVINGLSGG